MEKEKKRPGLNSLNEKEEREGVGLVLECLGVFLIFGEKRAHTPPGSVTPVAPGD